MAIAARNSKWWDWLIEQGICSEGDEVRRVVIDIDLDGAVCVLVHKYADDLATAPPVLLPDCVVHVDPPDAEDAEK